MREEQTTRYITNDGKVFYDKNDAEKHEKIEKLKGIIIVPSTESGFKNEEIAEDYAIMIFGRWNKIKEIMEG